MIFEKVFTGRLEDTLEKGGRIHLNVKSWATSDGKKQKQKRV